MEWLSVHRKRTVEGSPFGNCVGKSDLFNIVNNKSISEDVILAIQIKLHDFHNLPSKSEKPPFDLIPPQRAHSSAAWSPNAGEQAIILHTGSYHYVVATDLVSFTKSNHCVALLDGLNTRASSFSARAITHLQNTFGKIPLGSYVNRKVDGQRDSWSCGYRALALYSLLLSGADQNDLKVFVFDFQEVRAWMIDCLMGNVSPLAEFSLDNSSDKTEFRESLISLYTDRGAHPPPLPADGALG